MSSAQRPTSLNATLVGLALCVAGIAGLAVGWLVAPGRANALGTIQVVAGPACLGALFVYAVRRGGRAASWVPLLLPAMFLLDIARSPHVPLLSALGLAAAAMVGIAAQRGHQRAAIVSTAVSCVLLAATLIAGRLRH